MHQGRLQAWPTYFHAGLPTANWLFFLNLSEIHQRFPFQQDDQSALSFVGCGESGSHQSFLLILAETNWPGHPRWNTNTLEHSALGGYIHALGPWIKKRIILRNEQRFRVRFNLKPIELNSFSSNVFCLTWALNIYKIGYALDKI